MRDKIIQLMKDNNIEPENMLKELIKTYDYINNYNFININISQENLNIIKSVIWYNFEYDNRKTGISKLKNLGSKYPNIINLCNDSNVIECTDELINELNDVIKRWNNNVIICSLYSNNITNFDENTDVIIHMSNENPAKYESTSNYLNLNIKYIYCELYNNNILQHSPNTILGNIIELRERCRKAKNSNMKLKINLEEMEYTYEF